MALAKTVLALAPLIIKAQSARPARRLAGRALSIVLLGLSGLFLIAAAFVWVSKNYGTEYGFLSVGILFFMVSIIFFLLSRERQQKTSSNKTEIGSDPLARYMTEDLKTDPRVQSLVENIQDHPLGSTAAAVSLGFVLSNRIIGD